MTKKVKEPIGVVWELEGEPDQKPQNKRPKSLKLLILVHLRNYFMEVLNKFLMCLEIMS